MNELAIRAGQEIQDMAAMLAAFPSPDKWPHELKMKVVQMAAIQETTDNIRAAAKLAGINYSTEKETFLENAGRTQSTHTRAAYRAALNRLDAWAAWQKINPLELTPAQADDFIYSLRHDKNQKTGAAYSAARDRLIVSAASAFFTWLERRHAGIKNAFRGIKARPALKYNRPDVPSALEVETIIRELPADLAAAAAVMAYRGLRAGALPSLTISGGKFSGHSKGKDIAGELPSVALEAIKTAALPLRGPFSGLNVNTLEKRIARAIARFHKTGKVQGNYSAHDLRHFYAITEYGKDKDIYRVMRLLGHASIQVTANYLRGLGEVE